MNKKKIVIIVLSTILIIIIGLISIWFLQQKQETKDNDNTNENVFISTTENSNENTNNSENSSGGTSTSTSTSNIANESKENNQNSPRNIQELDITDLDNETLLTATSQFVELFFNMDDIVTRQMNLPKLVDTEYAQNNKNSTINLDIASNYTMSSVVHSNMKYVSHETPIVESNYKNGGKTQIAVIYTRSWTPDNPNNPQEMTPITETVKAYYQVILSNDYKIRDLRFINSEII